MTLKASGMWMKQKWWFDEDAKQWVRAGWTVQCERCDLMRLVKSLTEARAVMGAHPRECTQQSLFL